MIFESEKLEYKVKVTDDIYKSAIAFANTSGGEIIIGADDKGNIIGLENIDKEYTRLGNIIRDAVAPDITMFIKYTLSQDKTIRMKIAEGTSKPYYIKGKGLKPSGVYVRQGAASVPASLEQIRQMIKISDGDIFENERSLKQNLTFNSAGQIFTKRNIDFNEEKYISLGIRGMGDGLYTNMALLISEQCEHTVKVAVFADEANTVFKAHKEFGGSLFSQLESTFDYLMLCNQNPSEFYGVDRVDNWDYPKEALREALLNALVHRDYSFSGSIIINVNNHFIEFISIGGLLPGLSAEDIKSGISQPRNRNLAEMFHRLNFIESYGTGIRKIYALYNNCSVKPKIEITPNTFKIILPNMNAQASILAETVKLEQYNIITPQKHAVLDFLRKNGEMTETQLQNLLMVKKTRGFILAKEMASQGLIEIVGRGVSKRYRLRR